MKVKLDRKFEKQSLNNFPVLTRMAADADFVIDLISERQPVSTGGLSFEDCQSLIAPVLFCQIKTNNGSFPWTPVISGQ